MAVINVSGSTNFATLQIADDAADLAVTANVLSVQNMQDVTVTNSTGIFRYKTLDSGSESAVTTPSTNQVTLNVVVDDADFFGDAGGNSTVQTSGLFGTSNDKTEIHFRVYFDGTDSGSQYLQGQGFIAGLAPTVNPDAPLWVTPVTIEVNGDLTKGSVA